MSEGDVPFSRLFVLGGKDLTEEIFHEEFGEYGNIKDVWCVKDRKTNEKKGIVYIRFSKASEAIKAREMMDGRTLAGQSKPLKVLIASDRQDGNVRDDDDDDKFQRLFIKISKSSSYTKDDLENDFSKYGDIEHINILKDKNSGNSKGLAYITFKKGYHAALALENCDPSFKPVFAESRSKSKKLPPPSSRYDQHMGNGPKFSDHADSGYSRMPSMGFSPMSMLDNYPSSGDSRLEIMTSTNLSQERLHALLDIVPGLDYCDLDPISGIAYVKYQNAQCAAFAKERLSGFEYPIGHRLGIRYPHRSVIGGYSDGYNDEFKDTKHMDKLSSAMLLDGGRMNLDALGTREHIDRNSMTSRRDGGMMDTVQNLVHSLQQASSILQSSGGLPPVIDDIGRVRYTQVPLPDKKPIQQVDSPVAERLFIVSQPESFDNSILKDCFCRFGGLIDAYFMPRKNFGYAKFATFEGAQACMDLMHGQSLCGNRLKVIKADPPKNGYDDVFEGRNAKKAKIETMQNSSTQIF